MRKSISVRAYARAGDRDRAQAILDRFGRRDLQLVFPGIDPAFDSLRSDPRFADLLRRVGLAQRGNPTTGPR